MQVLARVENHWEYPFSDEFDSPTADPRWLLIPGTGSIEVDGTQGCLKLTYIPPLPNQTAIMPKAIQFAPGDWVMDMCVQSPPHPTDLTRDEYLPGVLISLNKQVLARSRHSYSILQPSLDGIRGDWLTALPYSREYVLLPNTVRGK